LVLASAKKLGLKNFGFGVSEKVWGLKFWFYRQRKSWSLINLVLASAKKLELNKFGFGVSEKVGA